MKTNIKTLLLMAATTMAMAACTDHDVYDPNFGKEPEEDPAVVAQKIASSFDYRLTTEIPVTFNYNNRGSLVEIYDADSTDLAVAQRTTNRARKIYSAFTGNGGKYTGKMVIPSALIGRKVYAFSKSIGETRKVEALVTAGGLTVNARTGGTRAIGQGKSSLPIGLSEAVESVLSEGENHDDKLQNTDINLHVTKDLDYIDVTFVWGGAGMGWWRGFNGSPSDDQAVKCQNGESEPAWVENNFTCNLYYFTYTSTLPTAEEIDRDFINPEHLVFEHADQNSSSSMQGNTVRLTVNGSTKIPAGTNIGWVVTHPDYRLAYLWPAVGDRATFDQFKSHFNVETSYTNYADFAANWRMPYIYSVSELNPDHQNQTIRYAYGSGSSEVLVYGIEDLSVTRGNFIWGETDEEHWGPNGHAETGKKAQYPFFNLASDRDYNDIVFIIHASEPEAIHDENIRVIEENSDKYAQESTEGTLLFEDLYPEQGDYDMNDVVITYKLTKYYNQDNQLVKLGYEFTPVWSGAKYNSSFSFLLDGLTDVVKVFDNQLDYLAPYKATDHLHTFTGEVTSGAFIGQNKDDVSWETFNPFITVHNTGYEVHLTKKTPSASAKLDGLNAYQLSYVNSEDNFPFAMNIPSTSYVIVTERVRIDTEYPRFVDWVKSNGTQSQDWYIK